MPLTLLEQNFAPLRFRSRYLPLSVTPLHLVYAYDKDGKRVKKKEVRLAKDMLTKAMIVQKIFDLSFEDARLNFQYESYFAEKIGDHHPHIATAIDQYREGDYGYLTIPYISGIQLERVIQDYTILREARAIALTHSILEGLAELHSNGIVDRDLKPTNIIVEPNGLTRIIDLDNSWAPELDSQEKDSNGASLFVGTPAYAAPEVCACERPLDGRADLYSLGIILYELVTGVVPFLGSETRVLRRQIHEPITRIKFEEDNVPLWARPIISKATEKDRKNRYQSPEAMMRALPRAA